MLHPEIKNPKLQNQQPQKADACKYLPRATEVFFSDDSKNIALAKKTCAGCTTLATCLEGAILRSEPCGVWGGQIFFKGKIVSFRRKRGRPSRNSNPEKELPVVPIPKHLRTLIA